MGLLSARRHIDIEGMWIVRDRVAVVVHRVSRAEYTSFEEKGEEGAQTRHMKVLYHSMTEFFNPDYEMMIISGL